MRKILIIATIVCFMGISLVSISCTKKEERQQEIKTTGEVSQKKEQAKEIKPQTACPVMEGTINKNIYADHNGMRIYFCCSSCIDDFKKDPEKYIKKLEEQGFTLEKTLVNEEVIDPVCRMKVTPQDAITVDYNGKTYYFCSSHCKENFLKNPEKFTDKEHTNHKMQ